MAETSCASLSEVEKKWKGAISGVLLAVEKK
jgi:hypothetical protein